MNAITTRPARGLYADVLPSRAPTLRDLANRAIVTAASFRTYEGDDAEWGRRDNAAIEAREDFLARLDEAGIDKLTLELLISEGVIW